MKIAFDRVSVKHKVFMLVAGLTIVCLVFISFIWGPQKTRIAELKTRFQSEARAVQVVEAYASAHPDMDKHLADLDKQSKQVDKMLPSQLDTASFLIQIDQASEKSGIQLLQLKPGTVAARNGYTEVPVEVTVKGDYFQTANFLKILEDSDRFNVVANMTTHFQQGILESKFIINIYCYGVLPDAKAASSPK